MPSGETIDASAFADDARGLLEAISESRGDLADVPGVLDGTLDRFRERVDRLLRESKVDNWRQVRIFIRDVDGIAADLAKASKDKRLVPKHVAVLDLALRKAKKRDFYGARKAWRKLDKIAEHAAEVRRLQGTYRDRYRGVETRVRSLRFEIERLGKVPKPTVSPAEADALTTEVDAFNAAAGTAYLDFLATTRADVAIPILLEAAQRSGVGVPAPPKGADPEPLLVLLGDTDPAREPLRAKSFYGLLELPGYSDAKLTHVMGDSRKIRGAIDAAWAWLKAIRDDERRSLAIAWTEDVGVLRRRVPAIVAFLARLGNARAAHDQAEALAKALESGRFGSLQTAARLYGAHGEDARRKWRGELEAAVEAMRKEAAALEAVLKKLPEPGKAAES